MNVLVVAAHPDDELLGCGATVARLAREGHAVYIAILGEGITSRHRTRESAEAEKLKSLHDASRRVADLLGAKDLSLHGLPDNQFDSLPLLEVIKIVEELIERWRPTAIYTHHCGDLNIDHEVVGRAVLTATRPMQGQSVRELYMFEIASSTEWAFQQLSPVFRPNVFVDIAETLPLKLKGMRLYETEARPFPHPRSTEALTAIAQRWGSVSGCQAAEAFEAVRLLR
ncbi:MAG TPA: PIG-L family deacetylase [Terriglobales bacterium]